MTTMRVPPEADPPFPPGATAPPGAESHWLSVRRAHLDTSTLDVPDAVRSARDVEWSSLAAADFRAVVDDVVLAARGLRDSAATVLDAVAWVRATGDQAEVALDALTAASAAS